MTRINIGGVPEHFNLPWHLTIEGGAYKQKGIELNWIDYPGGTGAMCEALRAKEIDMAIILTEGIVKDIIDGHHSKIVQTYIHSPLIWGVHVENNATHKNIEDLKNTSAAISRYGSGSHLMAYIFAQNNGWDTEDLQFEVVKNLDGAVKALTEHTADYFMWEHFTTKPLVDNKTFRRITDCPTPWPCFVIAVRNEILETKPDVIQDILSIVNATTADFKGIPHIDSTLAQRYGQKLEDIKEWLKLTTWSQTQIQDQTITEIQNKLFELKIIDKKIANHELTHFF